MREGTPPKVKGPPTGCHLIDLPFTKNNTSLPTNMFAKRAEGFATRVLTVDRLFVK